MKKQFLFLIIGVIALLGLGAFVFRGKEATGEVEYHFAKVSRGEVAESIEANGVLVALTSVDVKSKAGGRIVHLAVDEGSVVKQGDLIATIDPADTKASYDQATADMDSGLARTTQAEEQYRLTALQSGTAIADARQTLETAKIRLARIRLETNRQPLLAADALASAEASYQEAVQQQNKLLSVTIPQQKRDATGAVLQTKSSLDAANAELGRAKELFTKGYVSQAAVDQDTALAIAAQQAYKTAVQRQSTLPADTQSSIRAQAATVNRLQAIVNQARAGMSDKDIAKQTYAEAEKAVELARIAYRKAVNDRANMAIKGSDIKAAQAALVRNRVAVQNAKVQLDSTTVVAPRAGVVTLKYLEEGTIIPPGTSTFAQGTSLVQLSDVSQMFVDCTVDEADISAVKVGQRVNVTPEAFRDSKVQGVVERISPAAKTDSNVTTIKVRVKILPGQGKSLLLLPGMNASCEFITLSKKNVLSVPSQAIQTDDKGTFVQVKGPDPKKPIRRDVTVGITGNDNVEIVSGLKEGDEVVTAAIDVAQMEALQKKMLDAENPGGLAGGGRGGGHSFGKTKAKAKGK